MVFVHEMTQDGGQRRIKVDAKYSASCSSGQRISMHRLLHTFNVILVMSPSDIVLLL